MRALYWLLLIMSTVYSSKNISHLLHKCVTTSRHVDHNLLKNVLTVATQSFIPDSDGRENLLLAVNIASGYQILQKEMPEELRDLLILKIKEQFGNLNAFLTEIRSIGGKCYTFDDDKLYENLRICAKIIPIQDFLTNFLSKIKTDLLSTLNNLLLNLRRFVTKNRDTLMETDSLKVLKYLNILQLPPPTSDRHVVYDRKNDEDNILMVPELQKFVKWDEIYSFYDIDESMNRFPRVFDQTHLANVKLLRSLKGVIIAFHFRCFNENSKDCVNYGLKLSTIVNSMIKSIINCHTQIIKKRKTLEISKSLSFDLNAVRKIFCIFASKSLIIYDDLLGKYEAQKNGFTNVKDDILLPYLSFLYDPTLLPVLTSHGTDAAAALMTCVKYLKISLEEVARTWPIQSHSLFHPIKFASLSLKVTEEYEEGEILDLSHFPPKSFSEYRGYFPSIILHSLQSKHFEELLCLLYSPKSFTKYQNIPDGCRQKMNELELFNISEDLWEKFVTFLFTLKRLTEYNIYTFNNFLDQFEKLNGNFTPGLLRFLHERISLILKPSERQQLIHSKNPKAARFIMLACQKSNELLEIMRVEENAYLISPSLMLRNHHFNGTYDMNRLYTFLVANYEKFLDVNATIENDFGIDRGGPMRNLIQQCLTFIKNGVEIDKLNTLKTSMKQPNISLDSFVGPLLYPNGDEYFFAFRAYRDVGLFVGSIVAKAISSGLTPSIMFPQELFSILPYLREDDSLMSEAEIQVLNKFHDKMFTNSKETLDYILSESNLSLEYPFTLPSTRCFEKPFKPQIVFDAEEFGDSSYCRLPVDIDFFNIQKYRNDFVNSTYVEFRHLLRSFQKAFSEVYNLSLLGMLWNQDLWLCSFSPVVYTPQLIYNSTNFPPGDHQIDSLIEIDGEVVLFSFADSYRILLEAMSIVDVEMPKRFVASFTGTSYSRLKPKHLELKFVQFSELTDAKYATCEGPYNRDFLEKFYRQVALLQLKSLNLTESHNVVIREIPNKFVMGMTHSCYFSLEINVDYGLGSIIFAIFQQINYDPNKIIE